MKATISGVELFVMAYAWSSRGVAYMVSTCGKTVMHRDAYMSRFEDEYGNVQEKELPRPAVAHFIYEFLPLIDEHNKARQSVLALEKKWLTKNPWTRLLTTFLGMSVVDLQRWDRKKRKEYNSNEDEIAESGNLSDDDAVVVDDFNITSLANLISRPLIDGTFSYRKGPQPSLRITSDDVARAAERPIERITGPDGTVRYEPRNGERKGRARQQTCFICRRYQAKPQNTQWRCKACHMPLCQTPRTNVAAGRMMDCVDEHKQSNDKVLGCCFMERDDFLFPDELKLCKQKTRAQKRKQEQRNEKRRRQRIEVRMSREMPALPDSLTPPSQAAMPQSQVARLPEPTPLRRSTRNKDGSSNIAGV